jgi:hypothetical protein
VRCEACGGTGRDDRKTAAQAKQDAEFKHRVKHHGSYVRCHACNGNGLDPAAFFSWTKTGEKQ